MKRASTRLITGIGSVLLAGGLMVGCATSGQTLRPASEAQATSTVAPAATAVNPQAPAVGAPVPSIGQGAAPAPATNARSAPAPGASTGAPASGGVVVAPNAAPRGAAAVASQAVAQPALPPVPTPAPSTIRGIVVSGTGMASARPDQAIVSAGVQTRAATAQDAQAQNNQIMQAAINAIKALNVPDKDIQTTGVSLYPIIEQSQFISGYSASNNVTVTVENVDQAGAVLDAATKAGANVEGSVRFTLKDQGPTRAKALTAAAADARSKADALAAALGLQITGVESVSEASVGGPIFQPVPRALGAAQAAAAPSVPIEPGQLQVTAQVTVVFGY